MNKQDSDKRTVKEFTGRVISTGMNNTIVVTVSRSFRHPLYKKIVRRDRKIMAHCHNKDIVVGDMVRISSTKPISKRKYFVYQEKVTE